MSKAVLIVEDDAPFRKALERAVARLGYPARSAEDGIEALRSIRESTPGLVLLDLLLPRTDGYAVLEELRANPDERALPVVPMSAVYKDVAATRRLRELGCEEFLEKPFAEESLGRLLRKYLGRPESRRGDAAPQPGEMPLGERGFGAVLWQAMQDGVSGALHARQGKAKKAVLLEAGRPVAIRSNVVRECLGRRLLAAGRIDQATLDRSLSRMREDRSFQGQVLIALGAIEPQALDRALAEQGRDKLADLLGWEQGQSWFEPEVSQLSRATALEARCPQALLLDAAARVAPASVERALAHAAAGEVLVDARKLTPEARALDHVAALLAALERGAAPDELVSDHAAALFGLRLVGLTGPSDTGVPGAASRADRAGVEELCELLECQASQDHFGVLGIEAGAPEARVRAAFFELAKRFHPDRFGSDAEARELARKLFARVTEAHEALSDPDRRREYEAKLRAPGEDPEKLGNELLRAEVQFQKGMALLKQRNYPAALEQFDWALRLDPSEGEFEALYGWTCYLADPDAENALEKAAAHLENALRLSPNAVPPHYYAGQVQKACGDLLRAEKMFSRVLSMDPDHVEAARELRLLKMRRESERPKSEGVFGFGRRKK
ncbi:MAG: response regulator [Myxococcales bacterium]|nr:response regulator [Myxococcales bacterium]